MTDDRPPYVCFSGMDWWYHSHAHSDFQLLQRIAASRRVLFVNTIGMRVPMPGREAMVGARVRRKLRSLSKLLRAPVADLPDFHVFTPLSIPVRGRARAWNARSVRLQVQLAMRAVGIVDPTIVVTIPTAWPVARDIPNRSVIYNRCDKHSLLPGVDRDEIAALEQELLRDADHVLYVNRRLQEEERSVTGERSAFLDHGVDLDRFATESIREPDDLRSIPHPRAGFLGAIRDYTVDVPLLELLADQIPELQLVLVGDVQCDISRLTARPNVHWLGVKPYEEMPRYAAGLDVAVMPWLQNEWVRSCNPIKLKEHLAAGLAIVAMDFGDAERYEHLMRVAHHPAEFVAQVRRTIADGGPSTRAERRAAVADSSWDGRAADLLAIAEGEVIPSASPGH